MIKYFKELLGTLKSINANLEELRKTSKSTNRYVNELAQCVRVNHHPHGDQASISTKQWND